MSKRKRPVIITLILFLFAAGFYPLCLRLIAQIYYQKAVNYARDVRYLPAIKDLKKVIHFQADNPLIWKRLGETYHNLGKLQSVKEGFTIAEKAKEAYSKTGKLSIAKNYYHKTMDFDPKNKNYRKRYDNLQKSLALGDR